jgi:hypothetical protein
VEKRKEKEISNASSPILPLRVPLISFSDNYEALDTFLYSCTVGRPSPTDMMDPPVIDSFTLLTSCRLVANQVPVPSQNLKGLNSARLTNSPIDHPREKRDGD